MGHSVGARQPQSSPVDQIATWENAWARAASSIVARCTTHDRPAKAKLLSPRGRAESASVTSAYEIAREPGGVHHGWYLHQLKLSADEVARGIASFERQISRHTDWMADPRTKVPNVQDLDPRRQRALVLGWHQDIARHRACIDILRGVLEEKT